MFIDLHGKRGLLVGGGVTALRKAEKLQPFGIQLTAVAPDLLPEFHALPHVKLKQAVFTDDDLHEDYSMVIAATDNTDLNAHIAQLCRQRNIPVNVVDEPLLCTFQFPALVSCRDLTIGISTGGKSPTAAAELRQAIADSLPDNIDQVIDELADLRA